MYLFTLFIITDGDILFNIITWLKHWLSFLPIPVAVVIWIVFLGLHDESIITLSLSLYFSLSLLPSLPASLLLVEYEIEQKIQSRPRLRLVTEKH